MPKRQNYESDGGFVDDAPHEKKHKTTATGSKNDGKQVNHEMQKDDDGNEFWEISRARRVGISTYNKTKMISIRDYYEKDGKSLPGKKGISLPVDQFKAFIELLPSIEAALKRQGVEIPRPKYDAGGSSTAVAEPDANDGEENERESDEEEDKVVPSKKLKKNHETTDDEDE